MWRPPGFGDPWATAQSSPLVNPALVLGEELVRLSVNVVPNVLGVRSTMIVNAWFSELELTMNLNDPTIGSQEPTTLLVLSSRRVVLTICVKVL